jgi:hypothetical protein
MRPFPARRATGGDTARRPAASRAPAERQLVRLNDRDGVTVLRHVAIRFRGAISAIGPSANAGWATRDKLGSSPDATRTDWRTINNEVEATRSNRLGSAISSEAGTLLAAPVRSP